MLLDLRLAAAHHVLVYALVAMLAAEAVLLREPMQARLLARLARLDAGYGLAAGLLLVVGLCRVAFGIKGSAFYLHNPWFHAKLGAFLLAALLSLLPTLRFMRWRRALRADPAFVPPAGEIARVRLVLGIELALVGAIFVLAAAMARWSGA